MWMKERMVGEAFCKHRPASDRRVVEPVWMVAAGWVVDIA